MDNELTTTPKSEIEEAFDNIPEEVFQFMTSKAFDVLLDGIQHVLSLSDEQKKLLRTGALAVLIRLKSLDLIHEDFINAGIDEELAAKMVYAINTEIVERALNLTTFYTDDPGDEDEKGEDEGAEVAGISPEEVKNAPTPDDILASLEERLTKSRVVTPTTRNYSVSPSAPQQESMQKGSIDPYRELPGK